MKFQNNIINSKLPVTVAAGVVGKTLFLPLAVDTTSCCDDPGVWCGCVDAIYNESKNSNISCQMWDEFKIEKNTNQMQFAIDKEASEPK